MGKWDKWAQLAQIIAPAILSTIPGLPTALIAPIVAGLMQAQQLDKPGAQKKQIVTELIGDSMAAVNVVRHSDAPAPAEIMNAVDKGIDLSVAAINLVKELHPDATPAAAGPEPTAEPAPVK